MGRRVGMGGKGGKGREGWKGEGGKGRKGKGKRNVPANKKLRLHPRQTPLVLNTTPFG